MNLALAKIYNTHQEGLEKMAGEMPEGIVLDDLPDNLSDLALVLAYQEGDDIEKTASAHKDVLGTLIDFDAAGRYIAQADFSEMEKAAAEGDPSALVDFFESAGDGVDQQAQVREAIRTELQRRGIRR